jgi:PIN domain nuclease of toxin-antitoxin system
MKNFLLDTHTWIWWANRSDRLDKKIMLLLDNAESGSLHISTISCWEIAKLVQKEKIKLSKPVNLWIECALTTPVLVIEQLTPEISIESTQLPGKFHNDPADQIIVATARLNNYTLITADSLILNYQYVKTISPI